MGLEWRACITAAVRFNYGRPSSRSFARKLALLARSRTHEHGTRAPFHSRLFLLIILIARAYGTYREGRPAQFEAETHATRDVIISEIDIIYGYAAVLPF